MGVMKTLKKDRMAAATAAGNDNENTATAWLTWQEGKERNGAFGAILKEAVQRSVATRARCRIGELPPAMLEDIAQDAAVLLIDRYLRGNRALTLATKARHTERIAEEIKRSIKGAAEVAVKRAMGRAGLESARMARLAEAAAHGELPDAGEATYRLPHEQQMQLALAALHKAVRDQLMNPDRASVMREVLSGKPTAQVARERGLSSSAISQQVNKGAKLLGRMIERGEVEV